MSAFVLVIVVIAVWVIAGLYKDKKFLNNLVSDLDSKISEQAREIENLKYEIERLKK